MYSGSITRSKHLLIFSMNIKEIFAFFTTFGVYIRKKLPYNKIQTIIYFDPYIYHIHFRHHNHTSQKISSSLNIFIFELNGTTHHDMSHYKGEFVQTQGFLKMIFNIPPTLSLGHLKWKFQLWNEPWILRHYIFLMMTEAQLFIFID